MGKERRSEGTKKGDREELEFMDFIIKNYIITSQIRVGDVSIRLKDRIGTEIGR